MIKAAAPILLLFFLSCSGKGKGLSLYLTNDFNSLLWDESEKIYSLAEEIKNDANPKLIIETGDFFSQSHPENLEDGFQSALKAAEIFGLDAICADDSFLKIEKEDLPKEAEKYILSSNLYLKSKKNFSPLRSICDASSSICAVSAYIYQFSFPEKAGYTKDYRIENPIYEINKNLNKVKEKKSFETIFLYIKDFEGKKDKKRLSDFLQKLTPKPELVIIKSEKEFSPFKCKNIWIAYAPKNEAAKISVTEIPVLKIKKVKTYVLNLPKTSKTNISDEQLEKIRKEKFLKLSKVYSSSDKDIPAQQRGPGGTAYFMSKIISRYIKSNGAFYSAQAVKKGFKKGEIRLRDIYDSVSPQDRLIYCKIKGIDLEKMIKSSDISYLEYYPFQIDEQKEITVYGEKLKKEKIYRILIPQSAAGKEYSLLSYSMEFSVLNKTVLDAALWYFRTHKKAE